MYNETKLQDELAYMDEQMKNVKQKQYDWEKALNPFAKMDAILTMVQDIVDIKNKFINISDQCLNLYTFPMTNQSLYGFEDMMSKILNQTARMDSVVQFLGQYHAFFLAFFIISALIIGFSLILAVVFCFVISVRLAKFKLPVLKGAEIHVQIPTTKPHSAEDEHSAYFYKDEMYAAKVPK